MLIQNMWQSVHEIKGSDPVHFGNRPKPIWTDCHWFPEISCMGSCGFFTYRVSGWGHRIGAVCVCVCVSVCVCVCALKTELFDLWARNFTCRSTWTISRSSSMVKVKGQGHQVRKCYFGGNSTSFSLIWRAWCKTLAMVSCQDVIWRQSMTSHPHVTSQTDVIWAKGKNYRRGRYVNAQAFSNSF